MKTETARIKVKRILKQYLIDKEAAEMLFSTTKTLSTWRYFKKGPVYIKLAGPVSGKGRILYDYDDIVAFIDAKRRTSTSHASLTVEQIKYLTEQEAANLFSICPQALQKWRLRGAGPNFIRINCKNKKKGRVLYDYDDIVAFIEAHKVKTIF